MARAILCALCMVFVAASAWAQDPEPELEPQVSTVIVGGNVYGGGNQARVQGNTTVTLRAGDLNQVYAGARMADVGGRTFLNIDGENASTDIFAIEAYGGNDIAGNIGKSGEETTVPTELTQVLGVGETKADHPKKNEIDNTWKTFVHSSRSKKTITQGGTSVVVDDKAVIIGHLFGGSNGDYDYKELPDVPEAGKTTHQIFFRGEMDKPGALPIATLVTPSGEVGFHLPEIAKTYLELKGGCISSVYGGGNNTTVTENTTIYIDNESDDLLKMCERFVEESGGVPFATVDKLLLYMISKVNLHTFQANLPTFAYQFARVFGGNNKADMKIRPTWNLQGGKIFDLYSGGNRGRMTHPDGILLQVNPATGNTNTLYIENVYGGCRMADVRPKSDDIDPETGDYIDMTYVDNERDRAAGYLFPPNFATHTLIQGGDVNNVYGGNDITGKVYFGNLVGISTSIRGNVYGGGNGAYAYTDNSDFKTHEDYGDFYYEPGEKTSVEALNDIRPDAEQVSIVIRGKDADHPTIIGGSVYVGGNCATLEPDDRHRDLPDYPITELKLGSHVYADKVYLGNNGAGMADPQLLKIYKTDYEGHWYNSINLTSPSQMVNYMEGVAMRNVPTLVTEKKALGDHYEYESYTSYVGSLFLGGNVGSMTYEGLNTMNFDAQIVVYDKVVGGSNNANVPQQEGLNARYEGGIIGSLAERYEGGFPGKDNEKYFTDDGTEDGKIRDRLVLNFDGLKIEPKRWVMKRNGDYTLDLSSGKPVYLDAAGHDLDAPNTVCSVCGGHAYLEWNTVKKSFELDDFEETANGSRTGTATPDDLNRRLFGGHVYGGCYQSGHVNGNVIINLNNDLVKRRKVFAQVSNDDDRPLYHDEGYEYNITEPNSGVILDEQGMDVLGDALNVFGGGYGAEAEIWGSTTINLSRGYTFQIFGGGELGAIGRGTWNEEKQAYTGHTYDPRYRTTVNLHGTIPGDLRAKDDPDAVAPMAECEFIYGGGFEAIVSGDTHINLGNGRVFNTFAGCCNADLLGHTETRIGQWTTEGGETINGFPWIRDYTYGGNDLGGTIYGEKDFSDRVRDTDVMDMVRNPALLNASAYTEYIQGHAFGIFGGCFGDYDYVNDYKDVTSPYMHSAVINFRPTDTPLKDNGDVSEVYGAGEGYSGYRNGDKSQDRSYVLIDIPDALKTYQTMQVFGAGSNNGLGMRYTKEVTTDPDFDLDMASAVIDLTGGTIGSVFGGAYNEGVTRRSLVNVPENSTINVENIFGGAYGTQPLPPCDVYESYVNYRSGDATLRGSIYGGNNEQRRTLYAHVNISAPVWQDKSKGYLGTVYGAGRGDYSWAEYTEVNLEDGAQVYEVYGGGESGHVVNTESIYKYMTTMYAAQGCEHIYDPEWLDAWTIGDYYKPGTGGDFSGYIDNQYTSLRNDATVRVAEMDDRDYSSYSPEEKAKRINRYNTNVIINQGAYVANYAYGGGLGATGTLMPGDVWGSTYIALLGGVVHKDIYAAGTVGCVRDNFGGGVGPYNASSNPNGFTATANAYIKGGTCRNVYGGGWEGSVGKHATAEGVEQAISDDPTGDIPGETHVVIGDKDGTDFYEGVPAIQRNAYGGGEGGAVWGTAHLTLNRGYVGYEYDTGTGTYDEKIVDETYKDKTTGEFIPNQNLLDAGCLFGGGYIDDSSVDKTSVTVYDGHVRNSVFGGGEIAAIGRGTVSRSGSTFSLTGLYRPGKTFVEMYGGNVYRNVFGGGRGYNNLGNHGSLNSDGFVFGQTEVYIHGGVIGTEAGLADGDGNVFGGGDIGFVYSAYENSDGSFGKGVKSGVRYDKGGEGYYYKHAFEGGDFLLDGTEKILTEDCKVVIEPACKVKTDLTINGHPYSAGDYVPIEDLNTLGNKTAATETWSKLDDSGIIIHNAVFAGGNTQPSAATATYVNTASIFGNATASINDVYNRDLITLGTRTTGGLYGDGNMTFVDGYRELNITNYGTDYYSILSEISIDDYHNKLTTREQAYYELKYTCQKQCTDKDGTTYRPASTGVKASTITADDLLTLFLNHDGEETVSITDGGTAILTWNDTEKEWVPNPDYWKESGVISAYAGRLMNSIQRADFCGVFGSRMVMKGAQDRVPEEVDYTNYTINRVREVSLNKKTDHGNYFGIYSVVNFLGALSSDVDFGDDSSRDYIRTTDNVDETTYKCVVNGLAYGEASFYDWKKRWWQDRRRNNGNSHNKVALASGVYLELTTEESTGPDLYEKVWGPITGVVELDLINVAPGIGGGFVYAQNIHGVRSKTSLKHTTLMTENEDAVSYKDYNYTTEESTKHEWQTSGNFVHSSQIIIDDCYNISNRYKSGYMPPDGVPAHYWYIKGSVYVYDQYISAYTGVPNAYSETVEIPLSITAASHGKMTLLNVQPNYYAFYSSMGVELESGKKVVINDKEYYKNDPISFWDYYMLPPSEQALFVPQTYVNCIDCKIDGVEYKAGTYIMTPTQLDTYKKTAHTYTDAENKTILDADKNPATDNYIFRLSNKVSHNSGYILTYDVTNPGVWDKWYTPKNNTTGSKVNSATYAGKTPADQLLYDNGPTYHLNTATGMLLGQREYEVGNIISKTVYDTYKNVVTNHPTAIPATGQATFEPAYIVTQQVTVEDGTGIHHQNTGSTVSETEQEKTAYSGKTSPAFVCTETIQLSPTEFIFTGNTMSEDDKNKYINDNNTAITAIVRREISKMDDLTADEQAALSSVQKKELKALLAVKKELAENIVPAYYCTTDGNYGGNYYQTGQNYRGLEAWSSMSDADRSHFDFNYDALDLLIDPTYTSLNKTLVANKFQYDGATDTNNDGYITAVDVTNPAGYSLPKPVDYTATYNGGNNDLTETEVGEREGQKYMSTSAITGGKVYVGQELSREVFEALPNEQRHYAPIVVKNGKLVGDNYYKVYVVKEAFQIGSTPYAAGTVISADAYEGLQNKSSITELTFPKSEAETTYYYCRENYTVGEHGNGVSITGTSYGSSTATYNDTEEVPAGVVINSSTYSQLEEKNQQKNFTIHGVSPTETSTLYVSRNSDIYDLSKEKIITVVYQYDYDEVQASGTVTPVSERHVVNIHLNFESGMPIVANIKKPDLILPGEYVLMKEPAVTPGAYEILGGGWELFENIGDAESHTNGIDYNPLYTPLYWYQDDWYVAYYAKTYLGRTYSNSVPVSVANYHDIAEVMSDANKEHHMYVDHPGVKRDSKIYINDYTASGQNGLDIFKQLYDLSVLSSSPAEGDPLEGHALLNEHVKGGAHLEFFMRTDIDHTSSWTPIGDASQCFEGTLHGDGHRLTGLDHSLFGWLCGNVYNLGVMGTFQGAGVVDHGKGYVESCWVKTDNSTALSTKPYAVFGDPTDTKGYQVVNSYFYDGNKDLYTTTTDGATGLVTSGTARGVATAMPEKAFYNGELTYDLNSFYLSKRYYQAIGQNTGTAYDYLPANADGTLPEKVSTGHYPDNKLDPAQTYNRFSDIGYVEKRFADGDFRYAAGVIPEDADIRYRTVTKKNPKTNEEYDSIFFAPIWPDDYLFFGQSLAYGYLDGAAGRPLRAHQDYPSVINRSDGRLDLSESGNRVYRAPAYFRNSTMDVAHFNPYAVLAQTFKDEPAKKAYPYMTAIDFDDHRYGSLNNYKTYERGLNNGWFYQPLLDDDGLTGIINCDETRNLLVYAPAATATSGYANQKTYDVLNAYFRDPAYNDYYDRTNGLGHYSDGETYDRVADALPATSFIYGHLVQHDMKATNDHLLVDRQDFDCPLAYTFDTDQRMWYQRTPSDAEYVNREKGWQGISLPFTADLVTTHQKGEISHFYSGSEVSKNNTGTKIGHEYWLRGLEEGAAMTLRSGEGTDPDVLEANFSYPTATAGEKTVENTFLWDYYYEGIAHGHKDKNLDIYQTYYEHKRNYPGYAHLTRGIPYILGLPGTTYYEFDLSGKFFSDRYTITTNTPHPEKLDKQVITFASATGADIHVSDTEKDGIKQTYSGDYYFKPNYLNIDLTTTDYVLDTDGDQYSKVASEATAVPFRPFFTKPAGGGAKEFSHIRFSKETARIGNGDEDDITHTGELYIRARRGRILVSSTLETEREVVIVSASGATISRYTIQPGETVETSIHTAGVYLVNKKKLSVME